jgi:hypothetical protein
MPTVLLTYFNILFQVEPQTRLNILFSDLLSQMKDLAENDLAWTDAEGYVMPPLCVAVVAAESADGISQLQNTNPDCCPYCEIEGKRLVVGGVLTYPFEDAQRARPRCQKRIAEQAKWAKYFQGLPSTHAYFAGVQGKSCVSDLPRFDVVRSFSPDLGRLLLSAFTDLLMIPGTNGRRLANITPGQQIALDIELAAALVPPFATAPSFQNGVASWSSGQMLDWIIQFSIPCLLDKWPQSRLQHWACLVEAVYLLSMQTVLEKDLEDAQRCLDAFMTGLAKYFPREAETLPVHLLTHLVEATRNLGPLWRISSNRFQHSHQIAKVFIKLL